MILSFVVMIALTAPVAFAIGVSAAIGLLVSDAAPLLVVPQRIFAGADFSFSSLFRSSSSPVH